MNKKFCNSIVFTPVYIIDRVFLIMSPPLDVFGSERVYCNYNRQGGTAVWSMSKEDGASGRVTA